MEENKNYLADTNTIKSPRTEEESKGWKYNFWCDEPLNKNVCDEFKDDIKLSENYKEEFVDSISIDIVKFINQNYNNYSEKNRNAVVFNTEYIEWLFGKNKITYILKYKENICGIINAEIVDMINYGSIDKMANVNFVCTPKSERGKKLFIVLVKKIRTALSERNIKYGTFVDNVYLPKPAATIERYWRSINEPEKYITKIKNYGVVSDPTVENKINYLKNNFKRLSDDLFDMRIAKEDEYNKIYDIYKSYISRRYKFGEIYSYEEFVHKFKNSNVVSTYVLLKKGKIVDFISIVKTQRLVNGEFFNFGTITMYSSDQIHFYITFVHLFISLKKSQTEIIETYDIMDCDLQILTDDLKFEPSKENLRYIYLYNTPIKNYGKPMMNYDIHKMTIC